jgi:hypothetical protein
LLRSFSHQSPPSPPLANALQATPHVAGVVASVWSACITCTKDQIISQVRDLYSTKDVITGLPAGTGNRLVYSRFNQA